MFHNIAAILMTNAVVFHALLGCCAHHAHSCDANQVEVVTGKAVCSHDHHGHSHQSRSHQSHRAADSSEGGTSEGDSNSGESGNDQRPDSCNDTECRYVSNEGCDVLTAHLVFSNWLPVLDDSVSALTMIDPVSRFSDGVFPPNILSSQLLCAQMQVWRL